MKDSNNSLQTINTTLGFSLFGIALLSLVYLSGLRVDFTTQAYISVGLITFLIVIRLLKRTEFWHVLFILLSSFIVLRYFSWRITYTLAAEDLLSFIGTIALFLAELFGGLMFFLSVFVNIRPIRHRPITLPIDSSSWPSVDIIIPTYNEPFDLIKITLAAAKNIEYPATKLNIYLLDDGATREKLDSKDEKTRNSALARSLQLKEYCAQLGIIYTSRERNINAKAGNLNHALAIIKGELILTLDADHMPSVDILTKTVGSFMQDDKLCLVQTPHFFINPDPFEKNLSLFYRMPAESDMFYKGIQPGLDFWNASFFCGSAALLRREAIDEVGGFSGKTITEDSETTLKLHSKGWHSHYILYPLISGLQPETFDSFMIQRMRWAQGMVQNFIFNNPLIMPNLSIGQRVCYLSSMLFWFFPFARLIFLIAPGLYLFFGLKIYNANITEFFSYTIPFLGALVLTNHYVFSKVRWVFISEIYETMQSLFSLRAVLSVIKNPHKPFFAVTPKMETLHQDLISPLSKPFYWILIYTLIAIIFGVWRYNTHPEEHFIVVFTSFWALYNLLLLLATLGALFEHRQRRVNPRIPVKIEANWLVKTPANGDEKRIPLIIHDISMGGGNLRSKEPLPLKSDAKRTFIEILDEKTQRLERYQASITSSVEGTDYYNYGVQFDYTNLDEYLRLVKFIHGDSARWIKIYADTSNDPGLINSVIFMVKAGVYHGVNHIYVVLTALFKKIINVYA